MFTSRKPSFAKCTAAASLLLLRPLLPALLSPAREFCREGTLLGTGLKGSRALQAGRSPQKQSKGDLLRCDFHPRTARARCLPPPVGQLCPRPQLHLSPAAFPLCGIDNASAITQPRRAPCAPAALRPPEPRRAPIPPSAQTKGAPLISHKIQTN